MIVWMPAKLDPCVVNKLLFAIDFHVYMPVDAASSERCVTLVWAACVRQI